MQLYRGENLKINLVLSKKNAKILTAKIRKKYGKKCCKTVPEVPGRGVGAREWEYSQTIQCQN